MKDCDGEESVKQFADYTSWVKFGWVVRVILDMR